MPLNSTSAATTIGQDKKLLSRLRASLGRGPLAKLVDLYRIASPRYRYPLQGDISEAPFFIVGSGRSGTTLLRRILQASPEVHIPPELPVLARQFEIFQKIQHLDWRDVVHLVIAQFELNIGTLSDASSVRPLIQKLVAKESNERNLATLIDSYYRHHAEQVKPSFRVWGDKTPWNVFALDSLRSTFPRAKFVHVLRDGVDVVASMMKCGRSLEYAADRWTNAVRAADSFAKAHPEACYLLRYEDLVTDPGKAARQVCEFLAIEYSTAMITETDHVAEMGDVPLLGHHDQTQKPINDASIGKGRASFTRQQQQILGTLIEPTLRTHGYESIRTPTAA